MTAELSEGCRVRLSGLTSAQPLNGLTGIAERREADRWVVALDAAAAGEANAATRKRVKVRPANCILVEERPGDEDARLREALASHDRASIRSIMAARQARPTKVNDGADRGGDEKGFDAGAFSCPICKNLLYKPCVNSCGHSFCFWCMHHAMNYVGASRCPLCRARYSRLSAPFEPLHRFLLRAFPGEMRRREEETAEEETKEFHSTHAPSIESVRDGARAQHFVGAVDAAELLCVACHYVVKDPVVPVCGHIVCKGCVTFRDADKSSDEDGKTDTERGLCSECRAPILDIEGGNSGDLKVCAVLKPLLDTIEGFDESLLCPTGHDGETIHLGPSEPLDVRTPSPAVTLPDVRSESKEDNVHFGIGCDGCGRFPMVGHAFRCLDCPEEIGYDICRACFVRGAHLRPNSGRFNQSHENSHRFEEREQIKTDLHMFMECHPELTPEQVMQLLHLHMDHDDE